MIPWLVGGSILALLGYRQYVAVKPGDLIRVQSMMVPNYEGKMLVRRVEGDTVYGTVADPTNNLDTQVPVKTTRDKVLENLTPRFF